MNALDVSTPWPPLAIRRYGWFRRDPSASATLPARV